MDKKLNKYPEPDLEVGVDAEQPEPETPKRVNFRQQMIDVFEDMGGVPDMVKWAKDSTANRLVFYRNILPKLIEKEVHAEVTGPEGGPLIYSWEGGPEDLAPHAALEAVAGKEPELEENGGETPQK